MIPRWMAIGRSFKISTVLRMETKRTQKRRCLINVGFLIIAEPLPPHPFDPPLRALGSPLRRPIPQLKPYAHG